MRLVNRVILVVVLVALVVFGIFGAIYAFAGSDYEQTGLPAFLATPETAQTIENWVGGFENGIIPVLDYVLVIVVFLAGLVLLILEVRPKRRRYLQLGERSWINARVIEKEAANQALKDHAVLESRARLNLRRALPSKLRLALVVRRGKSALEAEQRAYDLIDSELIEKGQLVIDKVRIRTTVKDPRKANRRVK